MLDTSITLLVWLTAATTGIIALAIAMNLMASIVRRNSLEISNSTKRIRWGRIFLYTVLGGLVIGGLIFAYYQGWVSTPSITRANVLPFAMLVFALFFTGVMLATSWGRDVLGGIAFLLGIPSVLVLLFLAIFFPGELADMFSLQPSAKESVDAKRLRPEHDYTYELQPEETLSFDHTRNHWCILLDWEDKESVPDDWYKGWYKNGGDIYFLTNTHHVPVMVTVRMVYSNDVWKGMRC